MEFEEFKKEFYKNEIIEELDIDDIQLNKLYIYMKKIIEWNDKINITAITDEKMFIVKHIIDSLTVNVYLKDSKKIIDIGTGAGFPGIPLKIINEEKKFTLIDSINKKLNVIRSINEELKLASLEIIHTRAEDLAGKSEYREKYDVATTRAVSNLSTILEYMLPFIKLGGIAICMKGPNFQEELEDARAAIEILGGKIKEIKTFNIDDETERNLIIIEKVKNTPKKFPRGQGKPLKEPIK